MYGKALVVAQHDVEARLVRLDEVVFEQQRLGLGVRDRDFDAAIWLTSAWTFGIDVARGEIAADAVLQAARLADVQQLACSCVDTCDRRPAAAAARRRTLGIEIGGVSSAAYPASSQARASTVLNIPAVSRRVCVL